MSFSVLISRGLVLGTLVTTLAACGGPGTLTGGAGQQGGAALLSSAKQSNAVLGQLLADPKNLSGVASATTQSAGRGLSAQAFNCAANSTPAKPVDADADGVPLSATFTIDCAAKDDRTGAGWSIRGSSSASDKDDTDATSGYKVEVKDFTVAGTDDANRSSSATLNYAFDFTKQAALYGATLNFDLSSTTPQGNHRLTYAYDLKYTPDNAARPRDAGALSASGNASYTEAQGGRSLSVRVTDLHFSKTCTGYFDRGSVSYQDAQGNTLVLTYTGCNAVTATYNGQAVQ